MNGELLPVHGFVLAGGRSSRMGVDKATLEFMGRPMVEIAVEKLRGFCADVSIVGNRDDLSGFAEVVREERLDVGPGAGVEAGLRAARQEWAMFLPVDVPLVPEELLRRWAQVSLEMSGSGFKGFHLQLGREQPAFCMLRRGCAEKLSAALDGGERRLLQLLLEATEGFEWALDMGEFYAAEEYPAEETIEHWFMNVNTPQELESAERLARAAGSEAGQREK